VLALGGGRRVRGCSHAQHRALSHSDPNHGPVALSVDDSQPDTLAEPVPDRDRHAVAKRVPDRHRDGAIADSVAEAQQDAIAETEQDALAVIIAAAELRAVAGRGRRAAGREPARRGYLARNCGAGSPVEQGNWPEP